MLLLIWKECGNQPRALSYFYKKGIVYAHNYDTNMIGETGKIKIISNI